MWIPCAQITGNMNNCMVLGGGTRGSNLPLPVPFILVPAPSSPASSTHPAPFLLVSPPPPPSPSTTVMNLLGYQILRYFFSKEFDLYRAITEVAVSQLLQPATYSEDGWLLKVWKWLKYNTTGNESFVTLISLWLATFPENPASSKLKHSLASILPIAISELSVQDMLFFGFAQYDLRIKSRFSTKQTCDRW